MKTLEQIKNDFDGKKPAKVLPITPCFDDDRLEYENDVQFHISELGEMDNSDVQGMLMIDIYSDMLVACFENQIPAEKAAKLILDHNTH